nr:ribonuclease H-like domain-containing protein [Tanacetum cinerariifolium]
MYQIDNITTQTRAPQLPQTSRNTNPRLSTSTGVAYKTNASRPQLRSNQMTDKVVPNNSYVKAKKTKVEDHPRNSSISNKTKSVTACNDSLKSELRITKKPNVVPISTRKPKSQAKKSVATPHKKTVASESTTQKSKSYYRMLHEKTSKAWKWWIDRQCPSEMFETFVANDTPGLVPQRQKESAYDNSNPVPQIQNVLPSADTTFPSQQELDRLFGLMYDEFFNACTSSVNKSSSPIDNSKQRDTPLTTNIQSMTEPTIPTTINAEENNDNQAEDEFTNPLCTPVREVAGSSSRSIEAEYVALSASHAQVMWMKTQLKDYGFNYNKILLYCDSQSAIEILCNPVQHSRTKHIHTQYHFIKE